MHAFHNESESDAIFLYSTPNNSRPYFGLSESPRFRLLIKLPQLYIYGLNLERERDSRMYILCVISVPYQHQAVMLRGTII